MEGPQPQTTNNVYDYLMKILIMGEGSSRRHLLTKYLLEKELTDTTTFGLEYYLKDVEHRSKAIKLQLWDTPGLERFKSVTTSYYRGSHGALLVFSLSAIMGLSFLLEEIENNAPEGFQVILVATELDDESADANLQIARHFAMEKDLELLECDIEDKKQVESVFLRLIDRVVTRWESKKIDESIQLSQTDQENRRGCCFC